MIIVTGANGFIGSALVRELNDIGRRDIIAVDVVSPQARPEPLRKAQISQFLLTEEFLSRLNSKSLGTIDGIFHMGAISSTTETDWDRLVKNNIELSQTLFLSSRENNCPFIYASSGAVYGSGAKGFDDTTDPNMLEPLNLYGKSKVEFDRWVLKQDLKPHRWAGLRFFNVFGPNEYHKDDMCSMVYKSYLQVQSGGQIKLFRSHNPDYADGMQLRDFVYIKDITRWMVEIYSNAGFESGIYNMGFGKARPWLDLAKSVFKMTGVAENIKWIDIPGNIRNQYQYFTEAKMEKAFSAGLSKPEFSLERGIEDYFKKYLLTNDPYL